VKKISANFSDTDMTKEHKAFLKNECVSDQLWNLQGGLLRLRSDHGSTRFKLWPTQNESFWTPSA